MSLERADCDAHRGTETSIETAVRLLRTGGVVAIPTDTVYGVAASLQHPKAIERLFDIKGRPDDRAIPVLVSSMEAFSRLAAGKNELAEALAAAFWPGGLTIVVEASAAVPAVVTRGRQTVGLRMPDHPTALEIIAAVGGALAVTSANRSGDAEATTAEEVYRTIGAHVDLVVDAGATPGQVASTVVDATAQRLAVLRTGAITRAHLEAAMERVAR